jgi:rubrerythrin
MAQTDQSIDTLNFFLRDELSAVKTYRQAMAHVSDELARRTLEDCQQDHEHRVEAIRERIEKLGGRPVEDSQVWDTYSRLVQSRGEKLEEKDTIQALEEGENHELSDFRGAVDKTRGEARRFVRMELLPAQKRTYEKVSRLKRTLH